MKIFENIELRGTNYFKKELSRKKKKKKYQRTAAGVVTIHPLKSHLEVGKSAIEREGKNCIEYINEDDELLCCLL